jgi:outer membrane immunogenic protein
MPGDFMNPLLASAFAFVAVAGIASASAANLPVKARPMAPPPAPTWTGCYFGVAAGINTGRSQHTARDFGGVNITGKFDLSGGGLVGGTVGCNYQVAPQWLIGFEGDFSATDKDGNAHALPPFNVTFEDETRERWFATARGRLGFNPTPDSLVYATGGGAFAKFDINQFSTLNPVFGVSDSATLTGWTAGGGVELRFSYWQNVSLKFEYLFADFGTHTFLNPPITPGNCVCARTDVKTTDQILRAGLNWRLY